VNGRELAVKCLIPPPGRGGRLDAERGHPRGA
jgi:hypothetical protein